MEKLCKRGDMSPLKSQKHLIRIMKLTFITLFLCVSGLFAEVYSQSARVNLSMKNVKASEIINAIEEQTDYLFVYVWKEINLDKRASIEAKNQTVAEVLTNLLKNTDIAYTLEGTNILLMKKDMPSSLSTQQSKHRITGTITDKQGEPIIGANVAQKGTTNGTITDIDGHFTMELPQNATLLISYIGYIPKEVSIGTQTNISATLQEDVKAIEEVVVVGYGVQKKSVVTGAISSVKSEDLINSSYTRPEQALQGRTSGVQVLSGSGAPGAGMMIRVRGYSSNGNSEPLYIVDGLRTGDISNLEPNNIASMEVLKDGASAAIYGAEGGNGVVLITTKNGSAGKAQVTYDFQYTIQSLGKTPKMMNAEQYISYMDESGVLPGLNSGGVDTDWVKETFEASPMQKHNLTVSGGNEKTTYLVSLSYLDQEGIVKGKDDNYKRYSGMFNGSQIVNNWLKVGSSLQINRTQRRSFNENDEYRGVISSALLLDPLTPVEYTSTIPSHVQSLIDEGRKLVRAENGNYYGISQYVTGENINPFVQKRQSVGQSTNTAFMGNVYVDITPIEGLTITSKLGINYSAGNSHTYRPEFYYNAQTNNINSSVSESASFSTYWQWENFASYMKSIEKHNFTVLIGTAVSSSDYKGINASGYPLIKDQESYADLNYISSQENSKVGGSRGVDRKLSYFGRVNYDYNNKYLFQATVRRDAAGSSILPVENRWGTFPSFSAGWVISNEEFFLQQSPISHLKLRASWGQNGSLSNLGGYNYSSTIVSTGGATDFITWGGLSVPLLYPLPDGTYAQVSHPNVLGNRELRWETSEQFDIGVDLRMFRDRLGFTADYYVKKTKDLITGNTPPFEAGNSASPINGGNVENKGLDFELSWRDHIGDFKYGISANLSTLKNKVTYLNPTISRIGGATVNNTWGATAFEKGLPVWYFRGYVTDGIDSSTGDIRIKDLNEDGVISTGDFDYIGSAIPDITYGATLNMEYKGFDFSMFIQGQAGNDILMGILRTDRPMTNKLEIFYTDRWTPSNPNAKRPSATVDSKYWNSDQMLFDGSYLKIKQIQVGYTLPSSLCNTLHIGNTRVYASLEDFFTFTDYPGMDPEATSGGNANVGIDRGFYPISKKILFGLSLNF